MPEIKAQDWEPGRKIVAEIGKIKSQVKAIHEFTVSPDGEKIAVPVVNEDGSYAIAVNEKILPTTFELLWYLRYAANGKLTGLVRIDDMWTLAVDGQPMEDRYEYAWNPIFSENGAAVAFLCKRDNQYGVALNGKMWEQSFHAIRDFCISPDGSQTAATVQVDSLAEADTEGFMKGVWSVAINGKVWDKKYVNCWGPLFNADGTLVAAEVRTGICEYSIGVNDSIWAEKYGCVWEPTFKPGTDSVVAPVRIKGSWTLARDGQPVWNSCFIQMWRAKFSSDGKRLAAIVSNDFGRWTIAVDDVPWKKTWGDMVLDPVFSPDGNRVAAVVKENNRWTIAIDGKAWKNDFEMIWNPVFSPNGSHVVSRIEKSGKKYIIVDGKVNNRPFDMLWEPVFSPDGKNVLLRYIEDGKYFREVLPADKLFG